jgi:GntR family transcriptional regulator/MocR family aminotransferase
MSKRSSSLELSLMPRTPGTSAYQWLYQALRAEILNARLRPGMRLPATRDLARQYALSRGTIINAFELLKSEGYIEGSVGSGTYVSQVLPEELLQVSSRGADKVRARALRRRISVYASRVKLFPNFEARPTRAFRCNVPALEMFPTSLWLQLTARRWRRASTNLLLGCDALGYGPLREVVADYLSTSRAVRCSAEQVMIVSGVQEALDLATRLLANPGDRVCMEYPGYEGAESVFRAAGARVDRLAVDGEGAQKPSQDFKTARLIYVTPAHQFPLGITMSLPRRLSLLQWARKHRALIFEDDYDSEYRYSGRPVPALQGLDDNGVVLFAGSFSKVLFPALRLGYLVIPPDLVSRFAAAKSLSTRHAQLLDQAVLCDFMAEGHFGRHVRRMREVYAERLACLMRCARERLAGVMEISEIEAGLQTIGWLREGIESDWAAKAAAARNVTVMALSFRDRGGKRRHALQLGFAAVDPPEIRRGVEQLAGALDSRHTRD